MKQNLPAHLEFDTAHSLQSHSFLTVTTAYVSLQQALHLDKTLWLWISCTTNPQQIESSGLWLIFIGSLSAESWAGRLRTREKTRDWWSCGHRRNHSWYMPK